MRRLIIHIGMHKTGTTSIQRSLHGLNTELIAYMPLGNMNHSAIHSTIFLENPELYPAHTRNARTKSEVDHIKNLYLEKIENVVRSRGSVSFITSGEDISVMDEGSLIRMQKYFSRFFEEIKIIGYIRPPGSYMSSALQQRLVGRGSLKLESLYPKYRKRFEKFDRVFGLKHVTLKKFDRSEFECGSVVRDFFSLIGLDSTSVVLNDKNTGRSLEVAALLFAYQKYSKKRINYPGAPLDNKRLLDLFDGIGEKRVMLHDDIVRQIIYENQEDLAWIENRIGASLHEVPNDNADSIRCVDDLLPIANSLFPELSEMISRLKPRFVSKQTSQEATLILVSKIFENSPAAILDMISLGIKGSHPNPELAAAAIEFMNEMLNAERDRGRN